MIELYEAYDLEEALCKFENLDLRSACFGLLSVIGYVCFNYEEFDDESVEEFIYYSVPNKAYFNVQEQTYLSQILEIKYIGETSQKELVNSKYASKKLIFVSIRLNCIKSTRSDVAYYLTKILNKLFNDFVFYIFLHDDKIVFCTCGNLGDVYISEWFDMLKPKLSELIALSRIVATNIIGANNIDEYYKELSFAISREYIIYPESYEYLAYECCPRISDDMIETMNKEYIRDEVQERKRFYLDIYGEDYVENDELFEIVENADEDLIMLELEEYEFEDEQDEIESEYINEEVLDNYEDYNIDKEVIDDPVKLLEYLESFEEDVSERMARDGD